MKLFRAVPVHIYRHVRVLAVGSGQWIVACGGVEIPPPVLTTRKRSLSMRRSVGSVRVRLTKILTVSTRARRPRLTLQISADTWSMNAAAHLRTQTIKQKMVIGFTEVSY
jgi:hypothetical protein